MNWTSRLKKEAIPNEMLLQYLERFMQEAVLRHLRSRLTSSVHQQMEEAVPYAFIQRMESMEQEIRSKLGDKEDQALDGLADVYATVCADPEQKYAAETYFKAGVQQWLHENDLEPTLLDNHLVDLFAYQSFYHACGHLNEYWLEASVGISGAHDVFEKELEDFEKRLISMWGDDKKTNAEASFQRMKRIINEALLAEDPEVIRHRIAIGWVGQNHYLGSLAEKSRDALLKFGIPEDRLTNDTITHYVQEIAASVVCGQGGAGNWWREAYGNPHLEKARKDATHLFPDEWSRQKFESAFRKIMLASIREIAANESSAAGAVVVPSQSFSR